MTQEQDITQFNRMLDIAFGIGEAGETDQPEQGQDIQGLLQVATLLAAEDFRDELHPAPVWKRQADPKTRAVSAARWILPRRRAAFVLMALLALMVATLLAVGPERALAALRGLLGYIPGIGLVDDSAGLRVLAEPVSQTRDGVTVTIQQAMADAQRLVIVYTTDGLRVAAANSAGEGGPFGSTQSLRLSDGTTLEVVPESGYGGTPEPLINDAILPEGGWPNYASRLVYPSVEAQVDELTLLIPILETMPAGAAPENWELTFRLKPAPPDLTFAPFTVLATPSLPEDAATSATGETGASRLSSAATHNGFTFQLENVVELEDGFVLTGSLAWDDSAFPTGGGAISEALIPTLTDVGGQKIPIEDVRLDALYGERKMPWSFRTNRKIFSGPLVLSISKIDASLFPPAAAFEFDLGADPQIGQSWEIDRDIDFGGNIIHLHSVRLGESPDSCGGGGGGGGPVAPRVFHSESALEFTFTSDEAGIFAWVEDVAPQAPAEGICGGGGGPQDPKVFYGLVTYASIPTGLHRFSIGASIPLVIDGPWEVAWQPPLIPGPTPTPEPVACLTFEGWRKLIDRSGSLPAGVTGKIVVSLDAGVATPKVEPAPSFPEIQISNLDGSDRRTVVSGGHPALSPDGTRLLYTDERGFHLLDLSTAQDSLLGVDGHAPIWSSDGTRILFVSLPGLRVMRADGSEAQQIDVGGAEITPPLGWLPDNQTIIYSVMTGEGFTFVMRNLQTGEEEDLFSFKNKWGFGTVSPDGEWIAFLDRVFGAPSYGVFISRLDGSERRLVAAPGIPISFRLVWSPDSRWLLMNTSDYSQSEVVPGQRPVLIELSTCRAIALPDVHGDVEGWGR